MSKLAFGYRPLGWKSDLTAQDYLTHIRAEFDRLAIDPHKHLFQFADLWRSLRHLKFDCPSNIQRYIDRSIREMHSKTGQMFTSEEFGFEVAFRQNAMGNFTMTWDPDEATFQRFGNRADHDVALGSVRPINELLWIKDIQCLRFPIEQKPLRGSARLPTTAECLASDLLCLIRKRVESVVDQLQATTKVTVLTTFEFGLEDKPVWTSEVIVEKLVVGWEIVLL